MPCFIYYAFKSASPFETPLTPQLRTFHAGGGVLFGESSGTALDLSVGSRCSREFSCPLIRKKVTDIKTYNNFLKFTKKVETLKIILNLSSSGMSKKKAGQKTSTTCQRFCNESR